jgi:arsenical pump membrane protein
LETDSLIWCIAGIATLGVIVRPLGAPEYVWAVLGAAALMALGLLPWRDALAAAAKGTDVYLFLGGMMLLAEVARKEGLFDWLAALAVRSAQGSAKRLFLIVYGVGTLVTIFLSNDATAVVLTPAVYAARDGGARGAAALSPDLRVHRQRRQFRAANLQSGEPRHFRRSHAAAGDMAC